MSVDTANGVGNQPITLDNVTEEDLAILNRLRTLQSSRKLTPYRETLRRRLAAKDQKTLPLFQYQAYRVMAGTHTHITLEDLAEAVKVNQNRPRNDPSNPKETTFSAGQTFTPITDAEALMVDQDPIKFLPLGLPGMPSDDPASRQISELEAEIARLRTESKAKDEALALANKNKGGGGNGKTS